MSGLFRLFLDNLAPIFLIAGSGYVLGKRFHIDPRTFSQVVFYFFSPCLVFSTLAKSQMSDSEFLSVAGFAVAVIFLVGLLAWGIGSTLRLERHVLAADHRDRLTLVGCPRDRNGIEPRVRSARSRAAG